MACIRDQSTVEAIARAFTSKDGKRNKTRAMIAAGYDEGYADSGQGQKFIFGNLRVIAAIKAIDEKTQVIVEYKLEQAISAIDLRIGYLEPAAAGGNIAATSAITALLREKNVITGLTKFRVVDETEQAQEIADTDKAQADMIAKYLLKQSIAKEA